MNRVEIFILFFLSTLIFVCGGRSEVIRQDSLSATTMSPNEGETQYVGSAYINGGTYEIGLTKIEETNGTVRVDYTRGTRMDDGSVRSFYATDTWTWNPREKSSRYDSGVIGLNTQYQFSEVGNHTWTTEIWWVGKEFAGTGWKIIGGGSTQDTNSFTVAGPGGCS
jgi:hypothetical protein